MNLLRGKEKHTREICAHLQEQDKTAINKKKRKTSEKIEKLSSLKTLKNAYNLRPE